MIEVSTDSTKLTSDTIELVDNINPVVSTENSAYMEVNPAEYTLSSGGLFAGGKLNGTIPTWLTAAIDAEIQAGGSIANIIGPMQTLIDQLEVGVTQNISAINTTNTSINSRIDSVVSEVGANRAIDLAVVATKVTDAEATAIAVNQIGATFGGNVDAYITSITSAYATANLAYAEDVDLVSATLGATTATVTSHDYAIVTTIPANLAAIETALTASITDLQNQVDGSISTWFYSGSPGYSSDDTTPALLSDSADTGAELITNALVFDLITDQMYKFLDTDELNTDLTTEVYDDILRWEAVYKLVLPESDWVTLDNTNANDLEKTAHLGDIYYDIDTGFGYRYAQLDIADIPDQGVTFTWVAITDAIALQALQSAAAAQASADGKATVYLKTASQIAIIVAAWTAQEVIGNIGDLWINTIDGVTKSWNGVDTWLDTTNTQTVQTLLDIITLDGAISTEESARVADVLAVQAAALAETAIRVSAETNLDGLITAEEADRIAAIEAVSDAYKEYSRVVTLAISDGVLTPAEQTLITAAQTEVDLANARFTAIEVDSTQALTWSAGASKLITAPDGSVTGWSFGDGSNIASEFKIQADKFEVQGSTTGYTPIAVDTTTGKLKFTGDVRFEGLGIDGGSTSIDGGKITTNSLNADRIIVGSSLAAPLINGGTIEGAVIRGVNIEGSVIKSSWIDYSSTGDLTNWKFYTLATIPAAYEANFAHDNTTGALIEDINGYVRLPGKSSIYSTYSTYSYTQSGSVQSGSLSITDDVYSYDSYTSTSTNRAVQLAPVLNIATDTSVLRCYSTGDGDWAPYTSASIYIHDTKVEIKARSAYGWIGFTTATYVYVDDLQVAYLRYYSSTDPAAVVYSFNVKGILLKVTSEYYSTLTLLAHNNVTIDAYTNGTGLFRDVTYYLPAAGTTSGNVGDMTITIPSIQVR
jgi:hypothetical protein